ncbi:MAG: DUF4126 domain-containing protein [Victivallales bacterium]|nr:DUF4126 domain-containing protein [Victivallales bacterium]
MEGLRLLMTMLPVSLMAGVNLYATVAVVGISAKFGLVDGMPEALQVFDNWLLISIAVVMYAAEFVVDKFEFFDNAWDLISTFIRPVGAGLMGLAAFGELDPALSLAGALLCGGIALESHSIKAGSRAVLNMVSPAETVSNVCVSIAEDIMVFFFVIMALVYPFVIGFIALIAAVILFFFVPRMLKWIFVLFKAVFAGVRSWFYLQEEFDVLPDNLKEIAGSGDTKSVISCSSSGLKGVSGMKGFVLLNGKSLIFVCRKWFNSRKCELPLSSISGARLRHRLFLDILEVGYRNPDSKSTTARFVFFKDQSALAERLLKSLPLST